MKKAEALDHVSGLPLFNFSSQRESNPQLSIYFCSFSYQIPESEYSSDSEIRIYGVHIIKDKHIRHLRVLIDK